MLLVPELESLFEYVEDLLADLSLVSEFSSFGRTDMNHADVQETTADLVDMILLGNFSDVRRFTLQRTRDELYARLHEMHDASASADTGDDERELHFNGHLFAETFETRPSGARTGSGETS